MRHAKSPHHLTSPQITGGSSTLVAILLLFLWSVALAALAYFAHGRPPLGIDDAQIFLTYADRLSRGEGITYAKGIRPVEGFTSMLWMLILALVRFVGADEWGALVVSIALLALTHLLIISMVRLATAPNDQRLAVLLYLFLVSVSPAYATWQTITLMDTTLWGVTVALLLYSVAVPRGDRFRFGLCSLTLFFAPGVRPEAICFCALAVAFGWVRWVRTEPRVKLWIMTTLPILSLALLTLFRLSYFGHPLPNTFYAKVSSSIAFNLAEGSRYFLAFLRSDPLSGVGIVIALIVIGSVTVQAVRRFEAVLEDPRLLVPPLLAAGLIALVLFPIVTGGDHFGMFRFYQPLYPLSMALLAIYVPKIASSLFKDLPWRVRGSAVAVVISAFFLPSVSWPVAFRSGTPIAHEFGIASYGKDIGSLLEGIFRPTSNDLPAVGVLMAGGIARTYGGPIYDLMGLNNEFIGHFKGDRIGVKNHAAFEKEAFYQLHLDVLLGDPEQQLYRGAYKNIFAEKKFGKHWGCGILSRKDDPSQSIQAFFRRAYLDKLLATGHFTFLRTWEYDRSIQDWKRLP